VLAEEKLL